MPPSPSAPRLEEIAARLEKATLPPNPRPGDSDYHSCGECGVAWPQKKYEMLYVEYDAVPKKLWQEIQLDLAYLLARLQKAEAVCRVAWNNCDGKPALQDALTLWQEARDG